MLNNSLRSEGVKLVKKQNAGSCRLSSIKHVQVKKKQQQRSHDEFLYWIDLSTQTLKQYILEIEDFWPAIQFKLDQIQLHMKEIHQPCEDVSDC